LFTPLFSETVLEVLAPWLGFGVLVTVLLALDLFVFHRNSHEPSLRESAWWTVFWCSLAIAFNVFIVFWRGVDPGLQFLTGYIVEWSMSMDNVFVFAVIFKFFQVPMKYQYRVLFWGILGAIFMRLAFIGAGTGLIHMFDWVIPLFGVFLVYTAYRLATQHDAEVHPENNILLRTARRWFRVAQGDHHQHGEHFVVHQNGHRCITPLFLVLLVIESTDLLFAVDSVPAILAITLDPYIVFTSNVFAILGLRALYFLLAGAIDLFRYLNYGLSAVLGFVGLKMMAQYVMKMYDLPEFPVWLSLLIIISLLAVSIIASLVAKRREDRAKQADDSSGKSDPS
jgi:tellurite resistance protein TerC